MFKAAIKPLASLKLTVVLLALSILLIYVATGAQTEVSVLAMQHDYFYSAYVMAPLRFFMPLFDGRDHLEQWLHLHRLPASIPLPGGYTLGVLLLVNLLAAHATRFKISWKRSGILLIHAALIVLLVGEGVTSALKVESYMAIEDGQSVNYSLDPHQVELAVIDPSPTGEEVVTAISDKKLTALASADEQSQNVLHDPRLPFDLRVDAYYPNSTIMGPVQAAKAGIAARATVGAGVQLAAANEPSVAGLQTKEADSPSAYVTPIVNGKEVGTYLVSTASLPPTLPQIDKPQALEINGKPYLLQLRPKRYYKSYTVHLNKFSFDRYPGTNEPKNFSSEVVLSDPGRHLTRAVRIWMNHPLRYDGDTLYQADWNHSTERGTVLEVVNNPAASLPYIALIVGGIGLAVHFGMMLVRFLAHGASGSAGEASQERRWASRTSSGALKGVGADGSRDSSPTWAVAVLPSVIVCCALGYLLTLLPTPRAAPNSFDAGAFGRLPVAFGGRVQPIDSVARNAVKLMAGHEKFDVPAPGSKTRATAHPAIEWLLNLWAHTGAADDMPVIRVDHPQLAILISPDASRHYFSINEIRAADPSLLEKIKAASDPDSEMEGGHHDAYTRGLKELGQKLMLYSEVADVQQRCFLPPSDRGGQWLPMASQIKSGQPISATSKSFMSILDAFRDNLPGDFNHEVTQYRAQIASAAPAALRSSSFEAGYNRIDPLLQALVFYILALLLDCFSWLFWRRALWRAAMTSLIIAFVLHTIGLTARIYISGRPPVTNLPSSAIFIAWAVVLVCLIVERMIPKGICIFCGCMLGILSLFLANRLSAMVGVGGDTLGVLQAVLDTNVWLATHVVCITLGYAGTLLAGLLGIIYVVRGLFTTAQPKAEARILTRMIYGVVCFALLFSFVGTILGGIWADQSWGRFWGWDPKENGAALIVLANALLLHARWAGWAKSRGVAVLAIANNIVVGWSWFGTNMLGVGLHSYGFLDAGLIWLEAFIAFHLAMIAFGCIPLDFWRSHRAEIADKPRKSESGGAAEMRGMAPIPVPAAQAIIAQSPQVHLGK